MRRYGAWGAILLSTLYLVFVGGGSLGINTPGFRAGTVLLATVFLVAWFVVASRNPEWRPRSRLLPAIVVILLVFAISTVFSRHPRQSVEYLGYAVLLAGVYLLLVRILANPFFRARMEVLAVGLAVVLGGAYAAANVTRWVTWWGVVGHVTVPPLRPDSEGLVYGNPSAAMTIVVLFACSAIAVLLGGSRGPRVLAAVIGVLTAFAIVVSGSRAGWFAVGIAVVATIALAVASGTRRRELQASAAGLVGDLRARIFLIAGGVAALGGFAVLAPLLVQRLTTAGADLRLGYVASAQRMFWESPLVGVGPGGWVIERVSHTVAPETDLYVPHAHNIYVQAAAEFGILGILAGLMLAVGLIGLVQDGIGDVDPRRRRWGWAAAFLLTYFAAHQLLDVYTPMSAFLFAAAIPVAWLDATSSRSMPSMSGSRARPLARLAAAGGVGLVLVSSVGMTLTEVPAAATERAADHANAGEWQEANEAALAAVAMDPGWAPYHFTMGLAAAHLGDHERAATAFRLVAATTDWPEAWVDLAAEELLMGNESAARDALRRASRLGLQRPGVAMAIGDLAAKAGDTALSDRAFREAIRLVPSLAADPWWQQDLSRSAQLTRVVEALIASAHGGAWEVALMAGDAERARSLLGPAPLTPGAIGPHDFIDAWTGDDAALRRIIDFAEARPLDFTSVTWAARLESRRGNVDEANRYRQWAYTGSPAAAVTAAEMRVADHELLGRTVRGDVADLWGTTTFRRETPWNPWVPTVIQLELR